MKYLPLLLLLFCSLASAEDFKFEKGDKIYAVVNEAPSERQILMIIATRLDEISKELHKMNEPKQEYVPMGPLLLKKEKMK